MDGPLLLANTFYALPNISFAETSEHINGIFRELCKQHLSGAFHEIVTLLHVKTTLCRSCDN